MQVAEWILVVILFFPQQEHEVLIQEHPTWESCKEHGEKIMDTFLEIPDPDFKIHVRCEEWMLDEDFT